MSQTEPEAKDDWEKVGFVTASAYRPLVLSRLGESPSKPSVIATELGIEISHVSHGLRDLRDRGLVKLLVPEERRKGRVYGLTQKGRDVLVEVERVTGISRKERDRPADSDADWELVGFVAASTYRHQVLQRLAKGRKRTTDIAREEEINASHVSRALGELRDRDLVELCVPEETEKGRVYGITEEGRAALAAAKQIGEVSA